MTSFNTNQARRIQESGRQYRIRRSTGRRKSLQTTTSKLFRTHILKEAENPINTATVLQGDRLERDITFDIMIQKTTSASNGIIFEIGGASRGFALYINGDDIGFVAGGLGDDGVSAVASDVINGTNREYQIAGACRVNTGHIELYVDGRLRAHGASVNGAMGSWSDTGSGAIGRAEGAASERIPAAQRVTLVNASVTSPLNLYGGQLPLHFFSELSQYSTPGPPIPVDSDYSSDYNNDYGA